MVTPRSGAGFAAHSAEAALAHRDLYELPGGQIELYQSWETVLSRAERQLADAEVAPC
jgi:hypothetical protein